MNPSKALTDSRNGENIRLRHRLRLLCIASRSQCQEFGHAAQVQAVMNQAALRVGEPLKYPEAQLDDYSVTVVQENRDSADWYPSRWR
jgi:hypothetical protein